MRSLLSIHSDLINVELIINFFFFVGCGGLFKAAAGLIHSPNYPQNYDHDSDCGWLIEVPINHVVKLNWKDFDVEPDSNCTFDYVAVSCIDSILFVIGH